VNPLFQAIVGNNFPVVNLPDQFWNTLWPDLVRMDEKLAEHNINPDIRNIGKD
jgi:hypothetical protein